MSGKQRFVRGMAALAALLLAVGMASSQPNNRRPAIILAKIEGPILPPTAEYVQRALQRAEREGASCLLVEMNTPGGRGDSMRQIAQHFLNSGTPVVVYVAPAGAQAASAGAVIGLAAHLLAMAPGTNIGAAHPVGGGGENIDGDMREKIVNDFAAFTRSIAEKRGKSQQWAEEIIRKSVSITETEALRQKIADCVAANRADLLLQIDGRRVNTAKGVRFLATRGAPASEEPLSALEKLLLFICNPNVALILGTIATLGIIAEINSPGAIFPGVVGSISLILSLYAMSVLSVNAAGVALLLLSLILFVTDVYAPTHGVLTVGGVIAFIVGAMMLFNGSPVGVRVSLAVIVSIATVLALFFGTIISSLWKSRHRPPGSGPETLIGAQARARTPINPSGKAFADGTLWNALNVGVEPISRDDSVIIEGLDGLTLKVRRASDTQAEPIYKTRSES